MANSVDLEFANAYFSQYLGLLQYFRYTTTANQYISNIASCIKDRSPLVRKQTLTLITRLLQEDFLKWKGALFYRFISALLDECDEIKDFCKLMLI